jgi:hypothetical protein
MHKIKNFHEGHSIVGEWQGSGRVMAGKRHGNGIVFVNRPLTRKGNGMVCVNRPLMSAQQKTSRGNITVTFCAVSIPAEGSLSLVNVGRWSVSFADDFTLLAILCNWIYHNVLRKDRWGIRDHHDVQVLSVPPENVQKTGNASLRNPR